MLILFHTAMLPCVQVFSFHFLQHFFLRFYIYCNISPIFLQNSDRFHMNTQWRRKKIESRARSYQKS